MKKKLLTILAVIAAVALGGFLMINLVSKQKWEKQELIEYSTSTGGDMRGSTDRTVLMEYEDKALLSFSSAEWHYEDPQVTEYLVDKKALEEIKEVFIECGMYKWKGKKFSNMFVADGATTHYDFWFSDDDLGFSSQVFPEAYSKKLAKLDEVIERYKAGGEKLPGLVLSEYSEDEVQPENRIKDGEVSLEVCGYSKGNLSFRILNGTDEELTAEGEYVLYDKEGNELASFDGSKLYLGTIFPLSTGESSLELGSLLDPGEYILKTGDMTCEFDIR